MVVLEVLSRASLSFRSVLLYGCCFSGIVLIRRSYGRCSGAVSFWRRFPMGLGFLSAVLLIGSVWCCGEEWCSGVSIKGRVVKGRRRAPIFSSSLLAAPTLMMANREDGGRRRQLGDLPFRQVSLVSSRRRLFPSVYLAKRQSARWRSLRSCLILLFCGLFCLPFSFRFFHCRFIVNVVVCCCCHYCCCCHCCCCCPCCC